MGSKVFPMGSGRKRSKKKPWGSETPAIMGDSFPLRKRRDRKGQNGVGAMGRGGGLGYSPLSKLQISYEKQTKRENGHRLKGTPYVASSSGPKRRRMQT
jgi:hypothetical protein